MSDPLAAIKPLKPPRKQRSLASLISGKDDAQIDPATGKRKISGALAGIIHNAKMKKMA